MNTQEVITPEDAARIREYESKLAHWNANQLQQKRGSLFFALIAAALWAISYLASDQTGPINQAAWFTALTGLSFVGALATTVATVILTAIKLLDLRPVAPPKQD